VFKNLESFLTHLVLKRAKAFALKSAKAVVLTLHLLRNKVYKIVKLFLLNNRLKLTSNMSILIDLKEESSFKVLLFLTLYLQTRYPLLKLRESCPCPFVDSLLQSVLLCCT
jgi:hypothetical protein